MALKHDETKGVKMKAKTKFIKMYYKLPEKALAEHKKNVKEV